MDDDQQLGAVWQIFAGDNEGGALCFREDGYLLTVHHVVGYMNARHQIKGRRSRDFAKMKIEYIHEFPTLDIAILKIEAQDPKEKFEYISLTKQIELKMGEKLITHGHKASIPFSSITGWTSYKYQSSDQLENLFENTTLRRTIANSTPSEMTDLRRNIKYRPFRLAANLLGQNDPDCENCLFLNPNLPVIELDVRAGPGFSGCPVFREEDKLLVGMVANGYVDSTLIVPVDVLYYAAAFYDLIKDENQCQGETSSHR